MWLKSNVQRQGKKSLLNYDQPYLLAYRKRKRDAGGDGLFKRLYTNPGHRAASHIKRLNLFNGNSHNAFSYPLGEQNDIVIMTAG